MRQPVTKDLAIRIGVGCEWMLHPLVPRVQRPVDRSVRAREMVPVRPLWRSPDADRSRARWPGARLAASEHHDIRSCSPRPGCCWYTSIIIRRVDVISVVAPEYTAVPK